MIIRAGLTKDRQQSSKEPFKEGHVLSLCSTDNLFFLKAQPRE